MNTDNGIRLHGPVNQQEATYVADDQFVLQGEEMARIFTSTRCLGYDFAFPILIKSQCQSFAVSLFQASPDERWVARVRCKPRRMVANGKRRCQFQAGVLGIERKSDDIIRVGADSDIVSHVEGRVQAPEKRLSA